MFFFSQMNPKSAKLVLFGPKIKMPAHTNLHRHFFNFKVRRLN